MRNPSPDRALRWAVLAVLLVGLPALIGVAPAIARAPQPVVRLEAPPPEEEAPAVWEPVPYECRGRQAEASGGVQASYPAPVVSRATPRPRPADGPGGIDCPGEEEAAEPPAAWQQLSYVCRGDRVEPAAGVQASYPGPVVALPTPPPRGPDVGPPVIDCTTTVRVKLIVESPAGQRPTGIGADIAGAVVPQEALEGGFEIDLAPDDHAITLSQPSPDWELVSTECICTEAVRQATLRRESVAAWGVGSILTSFPRPVVAIDPPPNRLTCGRASASPGLSASAGSRTTNVATFGASLTTDRTVAPQPVVAIDGGGGIDVGSLGDNTPPASIAWRDNGSIAITDRHAAGGVFLCDWTVKWAFGDVIIETVTDPPGQEALFGYSASPGFVTPPASRTSLAGASPPGAEAEIRKGSWTVELTGLGNGWSVSQSSCTEVDATTVSSASGASATIGMDAGDLVQCRFELGRNSVTLREGRWRVHNRPTTFRCGRGITVPIDENEQTGSLEVNGGGERLVMEGLFDGAKTVRARRHPENPLRYTASVVVRGNGGTFKYTARLDVISAVEARARMRGTFKVRGRTCRINRTADLVHESRWD